MTAASNSRCPRNETSGHTYIMQHDVSTQRVRMVCRFCGQLMHGAPKQGVRAVPLRVQATEDKP